MSVQIRLRFSDTHGQALRNLEQIESLPTSTLLSNLIFARARDLGVWPVSLQQPEESDGETAPDSDGE